jgi:hypothetical protein
VAVSIAKAIPLRVRQLWHNPRVQAHFGSAIRQGGFVYVSSGQGIGILAASKLQTGRVAGRLIILDEDGALGLGIPSPDRFQAVAKWPMLTSVAWTRRQHKFREPLV